VCKKSHEQRKTNAQQGHHDNNMKPIQCALDVFHIKIIKIKIKSGGPGELFPFFVNGIFFSPLYIFSDAELQRENDSNHDHVLFFFWFLFFLSAFFYFFLWTTNEKRACNTLPHTVTTHNC